MSDYIKREDAIQANVSQVEFCKSEGLDFSGKLHIDSIINNLKHIPAADVVERKKGSWYIHSTLFRTTLRCANCQKSSEYQFKFCPNCGAQMESDDDV